MTPIIGQRAGPVSELLISRFGTLARIIDASPNALSKVLAAYPGVTEAICAARGLVMNALSERIVGSRVDVTSPAMHQYLRNILLNPQEERVHAIFLNRSGFYLSGQTIAHGSEGRVAIRLRELLHLALDCGAAGLILAHNHPSGSSQPSECDITATERLASIVTALEVDLVDHLIVSISGIYSLRRGVML